MDAERSSRHVAASLATLHFFALTYFLATLGLCFMENFPSDGFVPADEVKAIETPFATVDDPEQESAPDRRFLFFQATPAVFISTIVHVLILLVLGLVSLADPEKIVNVLSASSSTEDGPEMEEFIIEDTELNELADPEEFEEPVADVSEESETEPIEVEIPMEVAMVPMEVVDFAAEMAPAGLELQTLTSAATSAVSSRSSETKKSLLRKYGGNKASESAVSEALKWIALHQAPNGGWTFAHNQICRGRCGDPGQDRYAPSTNAATALALLPFLGAGQTHYEGEYKNVVRRGLLYLARNGKRGTKGGLPVTDLRDRQGNLYSHGLATITLCEAYAMTKDPALVAPAQSALNFTIHAQCPDGGWRYQPQAASGGDTSATGWQLMALKSGYMGHLTVPPAAIKGTTLYLNKVASNGGAFYGYIRPNEKMNRNNTAIGLLCRMYIGWDKSNPALIKGAAAIAKAGVDKNDVYYNYYAAQVLRHMGGSDWNRFNTELRDWLVDAQETKGGAKGSWHFPKSRSHRGPNEGGRLASTSLATMILEVYYRHMPLYADSAADEFPL